MITMAKWKHQSKQQDPPAAPDVQDITVGIPEPEATDHQKARISVTLFQRDIDVIDAICKEVGYVTRSEFIRKAIRTQILKYM